MLYRVFILKYNEVSGFTKSLRTKQKCANTLPVLNHFVYGASKMIWLYLTPNLIPCKVVSSGGVL